MIPWARGPVRTAERPAGAGRAATRQLRRFGLETSPGGTGSNHLACDRMAAPRPWLAGLGSTHAQSNAGECASGVLGCRGCGIAPAGRPPKFGSVTRLELIALACEPVERGGPAGAALVREASPGSSRESAEVAISGFSPPTCVSDRMAAQSRPPISREGDGDHGLYPRPPRAVVLSIDEDLMQAWNDASRTPRRTRATRAAGIRHATAPSRCSVPSCARVGPRVSRHPHGGRSGGFMDTVARQYAGLVHIIGIASTSTSMGPSSAGPFNARHGHRFVFHYTPKHLGEPGGRSSTCGGVSACGDFHSRPGSGRRCRWRIAAWNRDRAILPVDFHRLSVASWPRPAAAEPARGIPVAAKNQRTRGSAYAGRRRDPVGRSMRSGVPHVSVRAGRAHLTIHLDDGTPIARATPLGAGQSV
jgi:hypothetical protein